MPACSAALDVGAAIDFKRRPGLGGWEPGTVLTLAPHEVEVQPSRRPVALLWVPRVRVRPAQAIAVINGARRAGAGTVPPLLHQVAQDPSPPRRVLIARGLALPQPKGPPPLRSPAYLAVPLCSPCHRAWHERRELPGRDSAAAAAHFQEVMLNLVVAAAQAEARDDGRRCCAATAATARNSSRNRAGRRPCLGLDRPQQRWLVSPPDADSSVANGSPQPSSLLYRRRFFCALTSNGGRFMNWRPPTA